MNKFKLFIYASIPGIFSLVFFYVMSFQNSWKSFGVPAMDQAFSDLRQLTYTSQCLIENSDWNPDAASCDPFGRPYNYLSLWARVMAWMGIGENHTVIVGHLGFWALSVGFSTLTYLALKSGADGWTVVLISLCAVSPPAMLAAERGNSDIFIFFIVVLGLLMQKSNKYVSFIFLGIASLLKIYPIGSGGYVFINRKNNLKAVAIYLAIIAISAIWYLSEIKYIYGGTPMNTKNSFGVRVMPSLLLILPVESRTVMAIGLCFFLLCLGVFVAALYLSLVKTRDGQQFHNLISSNQTSNSLFTAGVGIVIFSYLVGTSWDYRLIFFTIVVAGLSPLASQGSKIAIFLISTSLLMTYFSYSSGPFELWADYVELLFMPLLAAFLIFRILFTFPKIDRLLNSKIKSAL